MSGIIAIIRSCRSDMVKHAAHTNTFKPDTIDKAIQLIWDMENRSKVYHMDIERKNGAIVFIKLMKSNLQRIRYQMIWIGDHHLNEILTIRILLLHVVERFLEVIPDGLLKIMSVQSIRVDVIPVVIIIILLKIAQVTNPDHLHHERCRLQKMLTGKLWTKSNINIEN